jgi:hypothetical protein
MRGIEFGGRTGPEAVRSGRFSRERSPEPSLK